MPPSPTPFLEPVFVTRPLLPNRASVRKKIGEIYAAKWFTNFGAQHIQLEAELKSFLGVPNLHLFSNGTVALEIAIRALGLTGEVITTPFTFAATAHALSLNGITPVFCDIKPDDFNIDPAKIEALITPRTSAIMPVHVFGNPCDVDAIEKIAEKHNLKVIYDAAHAFGVSVGGKSAASFGDISMFSFHSTKIFHTVEGGCLSFQNPALDHPLKLQRNFGIENPEEVSAVGTNGKMNEIQAAFGLLNLTIVEKEIAKRKKVAEIYRGALKGVRGITFLKDMPGVTHNYSYFPILVDAAKFKKDRDHLHRGLQEFNVHARKYFHPICSHFKPYSHLPSATPENLPVAELIGSQVLCLPIHGGLKPADVRRIVTMIRHIRSTP